MHVVMIIQGYHPRIGGAERQVGALAPLLVGRGIQVSVLTRRYAGLRRFEMIDNIPVYRLPVPGPVPMAALTFTAAALPLLWRLRPDVIHAHELFSPATTALAAKRFFQTAVVATAHRSGPLGDFQRMQQRPFGMRRLKAMRREVDAFTMISAEVDAELAEFGIEAARRFRVPNGVDTQRFQPVDETTRHARRQQYDLPAGPLVVYAGRLAPEKRVNQLIEVWPAVRATVPDAHLLVLGTGPEEARLREQAGPGIIFAGAVHDVAPWLQAADVWVLPSAAEGFSVAMLEAMATGLGIVLTDVGGARDAIDHETHGLLVPPDDPAALQAALQRLLDDQQQRNRLGTAARERVERDFGLHVVADQLIDVYRFVARRTAC